MIKPKKSLGQNFLIDPNIIRKIVNFAQIENNNILEIGPGTGKLTDQILILKPKSLMLIEKDIKLCKYLNENINFTPGVKIFNEDILKFNLEKNMKKNLIIFGNLPYNISTQILVKLLKLEKWPPVYKKLILMFQKEVAQKILAKYNTNNYGRITIISNWRLKIVNQFNISKNCFYPKPKIDSTVLVFEPIINKKYKIKNIENIEKITRIIFSNKRKMINKSFKKIFKDYNLISNTLKIDLTKRPSQLTCDNYYSLIEKFEKLENKI